MEIQLRLPSYGGEVIRWRGGRPSPGCPGQGRPSHLQRSTVLHYATAALLAVGFLVITVLHLRLLEQTAPRQELRLRELDRGSTRAGCSFDMLSKAWLPAECPRYGTEEYVHASRDFNMSHWYYFTDPEGSAEYDHRELPYKVSNLPGEKWVWTGTDREHMVHCAWIIIRLAHAYKMNHRVDILTANFPSH